MRGPNRNRRRRLTQNLTLGSIFAPVVSMSQTYLDIESMLTKVLRSDFSHFRRHRSTNSYQTWRKVSRYESAFENSKVAEQTFAASFYIRFHCHFPINSTLVSTSQNECIAPELARFTWPAELSLESSPYFGLGVKAQNESKGNLSSSTGDFTKWCYMRQKVFLL